MTNTNKYIFEANTTSAAIEKGLKELNLSRNQVDIRILEENKKSFFSILDPRVVKVEFTIKNSVNNKKNIKINKIELEKEYEEIKKFLDKFFIELSIVNVEYHIKFEENIIKINFINDNLKILIGYRGETLNSLETILNAILYSKNLPVRVSLNINNFRENREKSLQELAKKVAKTVIKNKKSIKLEPMTAYERKIIHNELQNNREITTYSVGEGKNRRIVISLK